MLKQSVFSDEDIDVLTAFVVKGRMELRGVVSMAALHCGYVEFCAGLNVRPLALDTFAEMMGRFAEKLVASRREVH